MSECIQECAKQFLKQPLRLDTDLSHGPSTLASKILSSKADPKFKYSLPNFPQVIIAYLPIQKIPYSQLVCRLIFNWNPNIQLYSTLIVSSQLLVLFSRLPSHIMMMLTKIGQIGYNANQLHSFKNYFVPLREGENIPVGCLEQPLKNF